jgi:hypothetical protein
MKSLFLMFALAACGGGSKPSTPSPPGTGAPEPVAQGGVPCEQEVALQCAQGVDGCQGGKTLVHVCVPSDETAGPPCEQEIAKVCPEGQTDACLKTPQVAKTHLCVY